MLYRATKNVRSDSGDEVVKIEQMPVVFPAHDKNTPD